MTLIDNHGLISVCGVTSLIVVGYNATMSADEWLVFLEELNEWR